MMLTDQVYAQASLLAGELEKKQRDLLKILCTAAVSHLTARLREGLFPEDCKADFVAAASLYALAALNEAGEAEEFRVGDLTVKRGFSDTPSRCLYRQAELIMMPFLKDRLVFQGV